MVAYRQIWIAKAQLINFTGVRFYSIGMLEFANLFYYLWAFGFLPFFTFINNAGMNIFSSYVLSTYTKNFLGVTVFFNAGPLRILTKNSRTKIYFSAGVPLELILLPWFHIFPT